MFRLTSFATVSQVHGGTLTGPVVTVMISSDERMEAIHELKGRAGQRRENDNHVIFLIANGDGTFLAVEFSDELIRIGTGVK